MPIQFVKSSDAYASSVAFSGNVTVGNCIVVVGSGSASITACAKSAGTATIGSVSSISEAHILSQYIHWFYCFVTETGTLTMALTGGGDVGIAIHEISGINSSDPFESLATGSADVKVGNGLSTTVADSILFNHINDETGGLGTVTYGTTGGTWVLTGNQTGHQHATEYLILTETVTDCLADFHITGSATNAILMAVAFNGITGSSSSSSQRSSSSSSKRSSSSSSSKSPSSSKSSSSQSSRSSSSFSRSSSSRSSSSSVTLGIWAVKWGENVGGAYEWNDSELGWTLGPAARLFPSGDGWGRIGFDGQGADSWAYSPVIDTGRTVNYIGINHTGNPVGYSIKIRGSSTVFSKEDVLPEWESYINPIQKNWRYIQIEVEYV